MVKFNSNSKEVLAALEKAGMRGITDACVLVESDAKRNAPVDDGTLRASITHRVSDSRGNILGEVGTPTDYAPDQEYGTQYQKGTPFLRPAFRDNKDNIKTILGGTYSEEVGK